MAFLIIVRRHDPGLFGYLQTYLEEPGVSVVLDRRELERRLVVRRRARRAVPSDRRQIERRAPAGGDPLWQYGFTVVPVAEGA